MTSTEDPLRWKDQGAPEGALALLASLEEPPPLPPLVRKRVGREVRAATDGAPAVPWFAILLAAAIALLAFMAGWVSAGGEPESERPTVAAQPETIEPEPAEPVAEPPPEPSSTALPGGPVEADDPVVPDDEPGEPSLASMRSGTHPDLLDPFAGRRSRRSRSRREPPSMRASGDELRNPFADRPPTMQATTGAPIDPFADRTTAEPARHGLLVINSIPWSRVFIDGEDTGRNTPVRNLRVSPGRHRVGLRTQDGTMHLYKVTVGAGETFRMLRRL